MYKLKLGRDLLIHCKQIIKNEDNKLINQDTCLEEIVQKEEKKE